MGPELNFSGVENTPGEHFSGRPKAWCCDCREWCYPDPELHCGCCTDYLKSIARRPSMSFRWYDLWVGAYFDQEYQRLFICLLPTWVLRIDLRWFARRHQKG